jgi:hypothetical protein
MHFSLPLHERRPVVSEHDLPTQVWLEILGKCLSHRGLTNCAEKDTDDGTAHLRAHMADDAL